MNHREPPHPPAGTRKAWLCLALLLPVLALHRASALTPSLSLRVVVGHHADPIPYLAAVGAPPLRFQEIAPVPSVASHPSSPASTTSSPSVETTATSGTTTAPSIAASSPETVPPVAAENRGTKDPVTSPAKVPVPILPDDARPTIRPEDFLPYFQIPGSARQPADVTLLVPVPRAVPAPAPLPPSSATYTQTPK